MTEFTQQRAPEVVEAVVTQRQRDDRGSYSIGRHSWRSIRAAPAQVNSTMMGILFLSIFVANLLVGTLAGLWETLSHASFFVLHAALAFGVFLIMLIAMRPIGRLLAQPHP